jgi:hypothetical protein
MLLAWDQQRARSLQLEIGWSEVGGCRRRAGYRLAGQVPDNPSSSITAVMGTAVDEATNMIAQQMGLAAQQEVRYLGILGHYDRVEDDTVIDVKTVGTDRWLEHYELHLPPEQHRMQVHGYASGLILAGARIRWCRIDYLARDTGREWSWTEPYNPIMVKKTVEWLKLVRDTPVDMLPRDYDPGSTWCRNCPFLNTCWGGGIANRDPRSVIFVEDPDLAKYAGELKALRQTVRELKDRDKTLVGILDAVRPDEPTDGSPRPVVDIDGEDAVLEFRPTRNGGYAIYFRARSAVVKGEVS